jgi:ribosomal protein S18 acetylase RimI-like enzyme
MKFDETTVPVIPNFGITLRKAEPIDYPELINLDALCFGISKAEAKSNQQNDAYKSTYAAELEGELIGKIGVLMEREDGYICGFGIKPEYRGRGYGRQVLSLTLKKLLSEQISTVLLEVAVKNENALSLYKSCGFNEVTAYDYYEIIL